MNLKTWRNGTDAGTVRKITEDNFKIIAKHLHHNMLSLTTEERLLLGDEYLSDGLIVYDKDLKAYYKYEQATGLWRNHSLSYCIIFTNQDWVNNIIDIPFSTHNIVEPNIQMFILVDGLYHPVLGGVGIDAEFNITLSTDMPFDGKVVIK